MHNRTITYFACACLALVLTGCAGVTARFRPAEVPVKGVRTGSDPLAIDVSNARGTVTIMADTKAKSPSVVAVVRDTNPVPKSADWAAAEVVLDSDRPVLRVLCSDPAKSGRPVDVRVTVPAIAGVRVRNAGGRVEVRNAAGAIDVQNGRSILEEGGDITVHAGSALAQPILLSSQKGTIELRATFGITGKVYAAAGSGTVSVALNGTPAHDIRATTSRWSGQIGSGDSDIRLETASGDVIVTVSR